MRKLLLIVLLAVSGNCAAADWADWLVRKDTFGEWIVVDQRQAFLIYADGGTIRESGGVAKMWEMTDFPAGAAAAGMKGSRSFKIEREYDCNRQQMRTLYVAHYAGNMGAGAIVGSDSTVGAWQPVMLGTIGDRLWRIACGKR